MARILIIHTGGTIGMTKTPAGYRPDGAYFRQAIRQIDDLQREGMPDWDFTETVPLLDSSNMNVSDWNRIGGIIADAYDRYDGFVVLHGTDTMAYTASALSFMLRGLCKPVILTGSQIPLCEVRSDGRDNLITSLLIAGAGKVREVCICFGGVLLRGNRATKYSADGMAAFRSPNYPPLATAGIHISYQEGALRRGGKEPFSFCPLAEVPIGVIKVFPGIQFELFASIMTERLKGVVVETFGSGNIPGGGHELLPIIRKAFEHGTVLTVCSQCPQATVDLGTYETSNALKEAGAVSGRDMTTEAAVAKLYYLFSVYQDVGEIKKKMGEDLRGEMS